MDAPGLTFGPLDADLLRQHAGFHVFRTLLLITVIMTHSHIQSTT